MDDLLLFPGVPAGFAVAYHLVRAAAARGREVERERRGWSDYAARNGLRHQAVRTGFPRRVQHRLEGIVEGVPVMCATGPGILQMPTTTVSARAPMAIEGRLYVSRAEAFSPAGDDLLARRVKMSDPDFNGGAFLVHATHAGTAEAMLVPAVKEALARLCRSGRQSINFRCDRDHVLVEWLGSEPVPELLDEASAVAVAACRSRTSAGVYR